MPFGMGQQDNMPGFPQPGFTSPYNPWGTTELTPEEELGGKK